MLKEFFFTVIIPIVVTLIVFAGIRIFFGTSLGRSKKTFNLILALILNANSPILEGGGIRGYFAWLSILFVVTFIMCRLPRINCAYQFFCNVFLLFFINKTIYEILFAFVFKNYSTTGLSEVILQFICIILALVYLWAQVAFLGSTIITNRVLIVIDRICSSFICSVAIVFLLAGMNSLDVSLFGAIILFVVTYVVTYIVDMHYFEVLQYMTVCQISFAKLKEEKEKLNIANANGEMKQKIKEDQERRKREMEEMMRERMRERIKEREEERKEERRREALERSYEADRRYEDKRRRDAEFNEYLDHREDYY